MHFLLKSDTWYLSQVWRKRGAGGDARPSPPHILADQLTLSQTRGADHAHHISTCPPPPPPAPRIFRPSYGPDLDSRQALKG